MPGEWKCLELCTVFYGLLTTISKVYTLFLSGTTYPVFPQCLPQINALLVETPGEKVTLHALQLLIKLFKVLRISDMPTQLAHCEVVSIEIKVDRD